MKTLSSFVLLSSLTIASFGDVSAQSVLHPNGPSKVQVAQHHQVAGDPASKAYAQGLSTGRRTVNPRLTPGVGGKPLFVHPEYMGLRGSAPVNDNCAGATLLTVGTTCSPTAGTVLDATSSLAAIDCATFIGDADDDVWYRFVATAANLTIFLDGSDSFDGVIDLRSGACNGTNIDCMDNFIAGGDETLNATGLSIGTTYRFRVYDYETGFPLDPTFSVCVYGTPAPPANDLCEGVVVQNLSVGSSVTFNGNNTGATDSEGLGFGSAWEAFTTTTCTNLELSYCGTEPAFGNAFLDLQIGCPNTGSFANTSFEQTTCANGSVTIFYENVPAGTWYYPVLTDVGSEGPYSISVSATACAPPDVYCTAGAVSVGFEKISNVTVAGINNTSTGTAGYENFTAITGSVAQGQSYPLSITVSGGFDTDQGLVWIDFNQNNIFAANELVFTSTLGVGPFTGNVVIPVGATLGQTRMRVRLHDTYDLGVDYQNTPNATPCDTSTFGQVEDYTLNITAAEPAPVNDLCSSVTATALGVGSSITFTGDNTGATFTNDYAVGSQLETLGLASVWHAFTTTECSNVTVSYCGTDPAFLDFWIVLATTCPADVAVFNSSFNTTDCVDGNGTIYFTGLPAGTYYLPVMNDPALASLAVGPYTIEVSAEACAAPPANDECAGAIGLDVNITCEPTTGDVFGGTESLPSIECNAFTGDANDDVWYSFVATGPNETISVTGSTTLDAVVELFEGSCGSPVSIACADATVAGELEEIVMGSLVEGTTYFVRVYDYSAGYPATTTFDICITGDIGSGIAGTSASQFGIRPNPSEGNVMIDLFAMQGNVLLEVMDVAGRLVHTERITANAGGSINLQLSGSVNAGLYTVRLTSANARDEQRMLVR
ncbi:MAG: T9SS type A sorting domain-containing protein [Flavobacteriales bacterium]|nr:T9SS type A sorting domain-containing protein [Flavobacteriales bacterium]